MASEWRLKLKVAAGTVVLSLLSALAVLAYPSPRPLVLCALAALPALLMLWRGLAALAPRRQPVQAELPIGVPADRRMLEDALLVMEARLEHAPAAIFGVAPETGHSLDSHQVTPLNGNARRLVAPGRANNLPDLYGKLAGLPVSHRTLIWFETERGLERAMVTASALALRGAPQRLVALMPMENELEAEAFKAWQQLVHVLTHEIMNSLTPVASLSRTACDLLGELSPQLPADVFADLVTALDAIGRRAGSLAEFVDSYRSISSVPAARPEKVGLSELFARLSALVAPNWQACGGRADFTVEPASLALQIDPGQIEQALLNLLTNAREATEALSAPEVSVSARLGHGGRLRMEVCDNGPGIPDALIQHVFTPFFTTKSKGHGIGLALVRQLVHGNGGTVRYAKRVGGGAQFIVTF